MQTAVSALLSALIFIGCLESCHGAGVGCALWLPHGKDQVCCEKCKPGNRMVTQCGRDPKELCVPCEEGTYIDEFTLFTCRSCTRCKGAQTVVHACSSSRDTVCGCAAGFRCVDSQCSRCATECGRGEQPTDTLTCQACPDGTFNDQIHHKCIPWRTSCPLPGQRIVTLGTAVHDIVCGNVSDHLPVQKTPKADDEGGRVTVVVVIVCLSALATVAMAAACTAFRSLRKKKEEKTKRLEPVDTPESEEPQWDEQTECSLCHPQQEQGGSQNSVASQGSEDKLLPV